MAMVTFLDNYKEIKTIEVTDKDAIARFKRYPDKFKVDESKKGEKKTTDSTEGKESKSKKGEKKTTDSTEGKEQIPNNENNGENNPNENE